MSCCLWKTPLYVVRELRVKMANKHPSITKIVWLRKPIKGSWEPQGSLDHTLRTTAQCCCYKEYILLLLFVFCFFPPHQVIDLINRYLGTGKKIVFRGQFIHSSCRFLSQSEGVQSVSLSTVSRQNDP